MRPLLIALIVSLAAAASVAQAEPYTREKDWAKEIAAMLEIDARQTPPSDPVVFTGSSSIRMWTSLRQDFPHLKVINRGFGGSHLEDLVFFAPKIVKPYKPKKIVVYSGENDIEVGQSPENVLADFKGFVEFRDRDLPGVPIIYISMKRSILRWAKWPEMKRANEMIKSEASRLRGVKFVDISKAMLGGDGKPRPELFLADGLHMNSAGYAVWRLILLPHMK